MATEIVEQTGSVEIVDTPDLKTEEKVIKTTGEKVNLEFSPRSFPTLVKKFADGKQKADMGEIPNVGDNVQIGNLAMPVRSYLFVEGTVRVILGVSPLFSQYSLHERSKQGRLAMAELLKKNGFEGTYTSAGDTRVAFDEDKVQEYAGVSPMIEDAFEDDDEWEDDD